MNNEKTKNENVSVIIGNPKKAIRKLAWPMIISMFLTMAYNLADGIWVAGLGTDALAALGFVSPLFMIIIGLGSGLGAGANSLIARSIGANDKKTADNAAIHSLILSTIISIILTIIILVFLKDILLFMGAGSTIDLALEYGYLVMGGLIVFILSNVGASILRSEGDVNRAMYAMAITAILNIVIDPIFIYTFNMGMAGAAWATLISASLSCAVIAYWLFIKKDTYLSFGKKDFKYDTKIIKDLLNVGIPASAEMFLISILTILMNLVLVIVSGNEAVAICTAGMRVINMGMIPHIGLGTAVLTVCGAAYGAKDYKKMLLGFNYSVKLGLIMSIITTVAFYIFAPQIAGIFTYTQSSSLLQSGLIVFIQITSLSLLPVPIGLIPISLFQGVGKGISALAMAVIREVIATAFFILLFTFVFTWAEIGVWWALVLGSLVGSVVGYIWAKMYISRLLKKESL
ncbi:MATE family efflux transporter [Methanobrevibacter sp. OttesenSCG-928-K11]|nr:MATE family efflux transporter [Methanobrevibacter sp. OttesenSCG-928-K11]MDL2270477.1 MATE family efflux transporter [Methanobrevibacter sp. OttesenSCG-928-I08]